MTYYIDVPTNTDLELDDKIIITVVPSVALKTFDEQIMTFTIEAGDANGVYKIAATALGTCFAAGDRIIVRGSVQVAAGEDPYVNNDGCYTVKYAGAAGYIYVEEAVVAAVSDAAAYAEEYDTFILHPTKRTGQLCVLIQLGATPSEMDVSFVPGGYWASKIEKGEPQYQGETLLTTKQYFVQVETAPYLQTEEEDLYTDAVTTVDKKGTLLMRLFSKKSEALTVEVDVAFVQLA